MDYGPLSVHTDSLSTNPHAYHLLKTTEYIVIYVEVVDVLPLYTVLHELLLLSIKTFPTVSVVSLTKEIFNMFF